VLILSQAEIQHIGQYLKGVKHSGTLGLKKSTMHANTVYRCQRVMFAQGLLLVIFATM